VLGLLVNINLRQSNDECEYKGFGFVWEHTYKTQFGVDLIQALQVGRIIDT
jgi:hypothetical protein